MPLSVLDPATAVSRIPDGATVMVGGFGLVGAPLTLIDAPLTHASVKDLTVVSNNLGEPGRGLGKLLLEGRVRKAVGSYFTSNPDVVAAHREGRLEIDLVPQGTLAEAIRAGGAGIGGFYTRTGWGTALGEGRDERVIRGDPHIYVESLRADVTAQVQAMAAGTNHGFLLRDASTSGDAEQGFHAREKAPDQPPQLVITFGPVS